MDALGLDALGSDALGLDALALDVLCLDGLGLDALGLDALRLDALGLDALAGPPKPGQRPPLTCAHPARPLSFLGPGQKSISNKTIGRRAQKQRICFGVGFLGVSPRVGFYILGISARGGFLIPRRPPKIYL